MAPPPSNISSSVTNLSNTRRTHGKPYPVPVSSYPIAGPFVRFRGAVLTKIFINQPFTDNGFLGGAEPRPAEGFQRSLFRVRLNGTEVLVAF
ncbi:hypothetical protein PYCCODRAFT_1468210 [Trametes coccinea BRFM310]|uniref:Uncharacterized protein n=1 Tax=Trametes coccinea (strain BRFM310) TaxID=1353009 RepID=A0A1Y2ILB3_TRAC3|nr:hypothetical protein PYCCODRAFT_1468210 [Trametes coccinea BRFM310]